MQQEILDIINKSLPVHLSETLRQELNESVKLKEDYKKLQESFNKLDLAHKNITERFINLENHSKTYQELEAKIKELDVKERNQKVFELETKLGCAELVSAKIYALCDTVFRNRQFIHNEYHSEAYHKNSDYSAGYNKNINTSIIREEK